MLINLWWFNFYWTIMLLSLNTSNWLSMWTMLEISSWIILILNISDEMEYSSMFKMYFMFSIISIILLSMWLLTYSNQQWIILLFALKMGMPPCHWWIAWIMKTMKWKMMWWFTTIHKFIPMMFSMLILNINMLMLWCAISSIFSALSTWTSNSLFNVIFYSSCMHANWMWMSTFDFSTFLMYFITYSSMMWLMFVKLEKWNFNSLDQTLSTNIMMMMGLPTSMLFFTKMTISNMILNFNFIILWIILMSNIFMLFPYSRMIWISLSNNSKPKFLTDRKTVKPFLSSNLFLQFTIWPLVI